MTLPSQQYAASRGYKPGPLEQAVLDRAKSLKASFYPRPPIVFPKPEPVVDPCWIPVEVHMDFGYFAPEPASRYQVKDIQKAVARHFKISVNELLSRSKAAELATPRHIAIYLCRKKTRLSLPRIGRLFDGRDHTTALNSLQVVQRRMNADQGFANIVHGLASRFPEAE